MEVNGNMPATGDRAIGEGRLRDDTARRMGGGRDRGRHPHNPCPLRGTCPRVGLGISFH